MQKVTITLLFWTTTAGLQMDAHRAGDSVENCTRSPRSRTVNFRFEDEIWHKTRCINSDQKHYPFIRPDTLYISLTRISTHYNYIALQTVPCTSENRKYSKLNSAVYSHIYSRYTVYRRFDFYSYTQGRTGPGGRKFASVFVTQILLCRIPYVLNYPCL